jgi:hypothetical protein
MKKDSLAHIRSVGIGFFGLLFILTFGYSQTAFAQNPAAEEKPSTSEEKPSAAEEKPATSGEKTSTFTPPGQLYASPADVELVEVGVAYNYINVRENDVKDLHGFDASLFVNLNRWLALGGDFIGGFGNNTSRDGSNIETVKLDRFAFMFGPRLNIRPKERVSIFGQALFGGVHDSIDVKVRGLNHFSSDTETSADAWAFDVSVGADWRLTNNLSWRIIQAGYLGVNFSSSSNNDWQDNWRISSGVVWSFGGTGRAISAK